MNDSMQRPQSLLIVAGIYIGTCFVTAIVLNALSVLIAPPAFTLAARTWLASFLFVGAFTTTCCAGGLLGIWFIIASTDSSIRDHIKTAILVGIVSSGLFFIDLTVGSDGAMLSATLVTVLSVVIALVVKTYTRGRHLTESS